MRQFSYYHQDTGELHGKIVTLNVAEHELEQAAAMNAPADHLPISGAHSADEKRVDVATREVLTRRTPLQKGAKDPRQRMQTLARIAELEARQARRVREILAEKDDRLKAIDEEIQRERADL